MINAADITSDFLCFRRIDGQRNMARFYCLSVEPTLFGEAVLVRAWGRIGTRGQSKAEPHADVCAARAALAVHARRRLLRGYAMTG